MHAYYACVACMRICHVCIQAAPQLEQTTAQAWQTEMRLRSQARTRAFFERVRAWEQQGHFARLMNEDYLCFFLSFQLKIKAFQLNVFN